MLNLFYEEPEGDRWLPFDRYPRRVVRRLVRGAPRIGGQQRIFVNLRAGLDKLKIPYRVNDYRHARDNPQELACIVGKPHVLDKMAWRNPILFGAAISSHPIDDPNLFERLPVKKVLVPGPWYEAMCKPLWRDVEAWPIGIDTELWRSAAPDSKDLDVLLYDKVYWNRDQMERSLIEPVRASLRRQGRSFAELRYGYYREEDFQALLRRCRTMVFLCAHEGQGIAYQQALSCGVPILAWDPGGPWPDPSYYPHKVVFGPVTSVPYWDERCGLKFPSAETFDSTLREFWDRYRAGDFAPRDYILEYLTLEKSARRYVSIAAKLAEDN